MKPYVAGPEIQQVWEGTQERIRKILSEPDEIILHGLGSAQHSPNFCVKTATDAVTYEIEVTQKIDVMTIQVLRNGVILMTYNSGRPMVAHPRDTIVLKIPILQDI